MRLQRGFFIGILSCSIAVSAGFDELLRSPKRPTLGEVVAHASDITQRLAFDANIPVHSKRPIVKDLKLSEQGSNWEHFLNALKKDGPRLVAEIDAAYPNAIFAFVGRDAAAIADVLEAYFLSLGEEGRVVRIGISKPSVDPKVYDPGLMVKLVNQLGFDVRKASTQRPFILVDTVSGGGGRQIRLILDGVYREFADHGGDPVDLVGLFDILGLGVSTTNSDGFMPSEFEPERRRLRAMYKAGAIRSYGNEHVFPIISDVPSRLNEMGYEHYTFAWHASFSFLHLDRSGQVQESPGGLQHESIRKSVLWYQLKIWETVSSETFMEDVKRYARDHRLQLSRRKPVRQEARAEASDCGKKIASASRVRSKTKDGW